MATKPGIWGIVTTRKASWVCSEYQAARAAAVRCLGELALGDVGQGGTWAREVAERASRVSLAASNAWRASRLAGTERAAADAKEAGIVATAATELAALCRQSLAAAVDMAERVNAERDGDGGELLRPEDAEPCQWCATAVGSRLTAGGGWICGPCLRARPELDT